MKTQYSRNRNFRSGGVLSSPFRIGVAIVFFCVLILVGIRALFPTTFFSLVTPVWNTGNTITKSFDFFTQTRTLVLEERDTLATENETLRNENIALTEKARDLQKLLGSRTEQGTGILAGVRTRPPTSPYDTIIIDTGYEGGVQMNARVYGSGGTPIGVVSKTMPTYAYVELYSSPTRVTDGWAGSSRIPVTLTGMGSGAFRAKVLQESGIVVGDTIFIAGDGALPIGGVIAIESDPSSPTVVLQIRPYTNIFSLIWVTVEKKVSDI